VKLFDDTPVTSTPVTNRLTRAKCLVAIKGAQIELAETMAEYNNYKQQSEDCDKQTTAEA